MPEVRSGPILGDRLVLREADSVRACFSGLTGLHWQCRGLHSPSMALGSVHK